MESKIQTKFTINETIDLLKEKNIGISRDEYQLLYEEYETKTNKKGYLQFRLNEKDKWKNVHSVVNMYFNKEEHDLKYKELVETKLEICLITHHKGFDQVGNKLNNHPDNLQWMGRQEHMHFHTTLSALAMDKIWNPENPEYFNYEAMREKISQATKNLWHGDGNEEFREKMKIATANFFIKSREVWTGENGAENRKKQSEIMSNLMFELWHTDKYPEWRERALANLSGGTKAYLEQYYSEDKGPELQKMQSERALNLWYGEGNEEFRKKIAPIVAENGRKSLLNKWHGPDNEEWRKNVSETNSKYMKTLLQKLWHGEGNEEYRAKQLERLRKRNSSPEHKRKSIEGKVFKIFNKIMVAGEIIADDTFIKYKYNGAPFPKTVFGSIEIAIKKYQYYPKRIKVDISL